MSVYRLLLFFLLHLASLASFPTHGSSAAQPICPRSELAQVADVLWPLCPSWIERSMPEEVHSDTLDNELSDLEDGAYFSVLFYASWCPFSQKIRPIYDALTSMFPQLRHLTVEESSAMPSIFSRHGIHSFPSILLVNRTAFIRYHGPKDLNLLTRFYRQITGQDPVAHFHVQTEEKIKIVRPWLRTASELLKNELYLALSLLFVFLRGFTYLFPKFISQLKAFWMLSALHRVNLGILSESSQFLGHFLHVIDIKRAWTTLIRSNKNRNFHKGAKSARVWASSLASVSLGESSSSRQTHSD